MAVDDKTDVDELAEAGLAALDGQEAATEAELQALEAMAEQVEAPGLQDRILERYQGFGRELLSDALPTRLDDRIARRLAPMLGDVSDVRIHKGRLATEAAQAMSARAFAIGDRDIFVAEGEFDPGSLQGAGLLAHEIAHTRDASTGFAMSGLHSQTSGREAFADAVADKLVMTLAYEDELHGDQVADDVGVLSSSNETETEGASIDDIDKEELEQRIWEILESQHRLERDRHGA